LCSARVVQRRKLAIMGCRVGMKKISSLSTSD
jgi:hypothetical protein